MPTTLDCELMRDLFGSDAMREIFDSRALLQAWLDAEVSLAEAEAELGVIPHWAAEGIRGVAEADRYDLGELREGIAASQHPLVPAIRALADAAGDAGDYVHWGATTQDILDTALVLQVRRALDLVEEDLAAIESALGRLAREHRDTPMAGRTHGQHAVPITFGLKVAVWLAELGRAGARLRQSRPRLLVGSLSGAAGTLAALGDQGAAVREGYCRRLGLGVPTAPWHVARDSFAELLSLLALLAGTLERIALELVRLQSTEIGEAAEPLANGHVGSSTMPQKRNPAICEYAAANCKVVRGLASVMHECMVGAHERDMGSWAAEWLVVPQALIMTGGALRMMRGVVDGIQVFPDRMARNLNLTRGGIVAESAMMALAAHLGRGRAHELVMRAAREADERGVELAAVLRERGELTDEMLDRALDPLAYLGESGRVVDDTLRAGGGNGSS